MHISGDGIPRYKGGLHIHTNKSDGQKSPAEAAQFYRSAGYDFIALTDHWVYNPGGVYDGFTVLSGIEYDVGSDTREGIWHIVGIGCEKDPALMSGIPGITGSLGKAQYITDSINGAGGCAILAHPVWSLNRPSEIMRLKGLAGIEIYNAVSGMPWGNRADSSALLDIMAADGFMLPVHAADDSHWYLSEAGSSCIYAKAAGLLPGQLMKAVGSGDLFASRGPVLEVRREKNTLYVTCSPVSDIIFQTGKVWIPDRVQCGTELTSAEYTIKPSDIFVRIEVSDRNGNTAWTGYYV